MYLPGTGKEAVMKKRQVNFELLRILCMYMIVVGHCLFHGRVTAKLGYGTVNYFLSYLIQSFSVVHVNCFVMLAGYSLLSIFFSYKIVPDSTSMTTAESAESFILASAGSACNSKKIPITADSAIFIPVVLFIIFLHYFSILCFVDS